MSKKRTLIIVDSITPEEFLANEDIRESLAKLEDACEIEVIESECFSLYDSPLVYVQRCEKEGPEFYEPSEELLAKLVDVEILLVHWAAVNSKMIDAAPKLQFVGAMRSGFEHISKEYAESKGITVRNAPGRLANSVADLTLGLILCENKGILRNNIRATKGKFVHETKYADAGNRPLCMQKAGLVGFGIIAQQVAKRLKACGSTIYAYDPFMPDEVFAQAGVQRFANLEEMIPLCDIVSLHVRLSEETRGMFGRKQFALMKPTAIFVNTARAGLADEDALIEALQNETIRGACLDVFAKEPIPEDYPLLAMENVSATPHTGGVFTGMFELSFGMIADTLEKWLNE